MVSLGRYDEMVPVPSTTRFPVEVDPPAKFTPADPTTWPIADGRFEYVAGRLLYMPPCADVQHDVCGSLVTVLGAWAERRADFVVAANEAGMLLGDEVRGADAAIWRRAALGTHTGGYRRVPPVLAVEVAGQKEDEPQLRDEATWYLSHGVAIVWLVLPQAREVVVLEVNAEQRLGRDERLPEHPLLPGLAVDVARLFVQLGAP